MMLNPRKGQRLQVWYNARVRGLMPLHGKVGFVRFATRSRPRNHGIEIDGKLYSIPCGNLRKAEGAGR